MPKKRVSSPGRSKPKKITSPQSQIRATAEAYWAALIKAGYLQGPVGQLTIHPGVLLLLDASYEVLAGGTVTEAVPGQLTVTAGIPAKVQQFKRLRNARLRAINRGGGPQRLRMRTG